MVTLRSKKISQLLNVQINIFLSVGTVLGYHVQLQKGYGLTLIRKSSNKDRALKVTKIFENNVVCKFGPRDQWDRIHKRSYEYLAKIF